MTVTNRETLQQVMAQIAAMRRAWEKVAQRLSDAEDAMYATPEGVAFTEAEGAWAQLRTEMTTAEAMARALIVEEYRETGSKKPLEGAGIRVNRRVAYDFDRALAWCRENAPAFLTLHIKAFDKAVAAGLPGAPAEIEEVPTATIAKDLSMYLESEEETS